MKRIFIFPTIEEAKAFILTQPRDPVFVAGVGAAEIAAATVRAIKAKKPQLAVLAGIAGAYDSTLRRGEVIEVVTERIAGIPARYAREYRTTGPDLGLPLAAGVTVNRSGEGLRETTESDGPGTADMTANGKEKCFTAAGTAIPTPPEQSGAGQAKAATRTDTAVQIVARNPSPGHDCDTGTGGAGDPDAAELVAGQTSPEQARTTEAADFGDFGDFGQDDTLPEIENMEGAAFFAVCEALGVACCQIRAVSNYVGEPLGQWAVGEAVANLTGKLTQIFGNDE